MLASKVISLTEIYTKLSPLTTVLGNSTNSFKIAHQLNEDFRNELVSYPMGLSLFFRFYYFDDFP